MSQGPALIAVAGNGILQWELTEEQLGSGALLNPKSFASIVKYWASPMRPSFLLAIAFATSATAVAQPKFETASVKRTDRCTLQNSLDPGMIALRGDPLNLVLMEAFKVKVTQITGPSWLGEDCFEIVARMPQGATPDQVPAMLQALLIERFKLSAHKESRTQSGYALVVDRNGPKFKESDPLADTNAMHRDQRVFRAGPGLAGTKGSMTMESLARYLLDKGYGTVEDATNLKGKYEIDLSWSPDPAFEQPGRLGPERANAEPLPDLFSAIRESLGLRLEPRKVRVEVLVIDNVERVPAEN
jgi:uncharacterized protein (TIGR03435 family)